MPDDALINSKVMTTDDLLKIIGIKETENYILRHDIELLKIKLSELKVVPLKKQS